MKQRKQRDSTTHLAEKWNSRNQDYNTVNKNFWLSHSQCNKVTTAVSAAWGGNLGARHVFIAHFSSCFVSEQAQPE